MPSRTRKRRRRRSRSRRRHRSKSLRRRSRRRGKVRNKSIDEISRRFQGMSVATSLTKPMTKKRRKKRDPIDELTRGLEKSLNVAFSPTLFKVCHRLTTVPRKCNAFPVCTFDKKRGRCMPSSRKINRYY